LKSSFLTAQSFTIESTLDYREIVILEFGCERDGEKEAIENEKGIAKEGSPTGGRDSPVLKQELHA